MKASLSPKPTELMNSLLCAGRRVLLAGIFGSFVLHADSAFAQSTTGDDDTNQIRVAVIEGKVEISPAGPTRWFLAQTNQPLFPSDRLRTGPNSRVTVRWSKQSAVSFGPLTEFEILPPHAPEALFGMNFIKGILSFFHRDKPGRIRIITTGAVAGIEGTEFVLSVETTNNTERTTLSLIDGRVSLTNELGTRVLTSGQRAVAEVGKAPVITGGFIANNVLQWCFYYPAVLDLGELPLTAEEQSILRESLAA